jgi:5,10-methylenetetrahydromethanopterin reductase
MPSLGIKFPDTDSLAIEDTLECAQAADRAGFESLWMSDYATGDVFAILSACAVATEQIKLGTGVAIIFNRAPVSMALGAASLDTISKGRALLGMGIGHRSIVEDQVAGIPYERPVRRLREYTEIVRELIHDGELSYRGELFSLDYKPWVKFFRPQIPILHSPFVEAAARRAGALADGTLHTCVTPERVGQNAQWVAEGAREAGRDHAAIEIGAYLWTIVTPDAATRETGRRLIKSQLAWYAGELPLYANLLRQSGFADNVDHVAAIWKGGDQEAAIDAVADEIVDTIGLVGDLDHCRARIQEYRDAGLHRPVIYPMPLNPTETKKAFLSAVQIMEP